MEHNFLGKAIRLIAGSCSYDSDASTIIKWRSSDVTQPSQEAIDAEVVRLQAEYDAQEYARKREAEYPSIADLVVALYDTSDKSALVAKRAEVKAKYPKPE